MELSDSIRKYLKLGLSATTLIVLVIVTNSVQYLTNCLIIGLQNDKVRASEPLVAPEGCRVVLINNTVDIRFERCESKMNVYLKGVFMKEFDENGMRVSRTWLDDCWPVKDVSSCELYRTPIPRSGVVSCRLYSLMSEDVRLCYTDFKKVIGFMINGFLFDVVESQMMRDLIYGK